MWQIALSAITTAGFVGVVFGAGKIGGVCGIIVSTVLLALNSYTKNYDLGELAQKHKQAANDLWLIVLRSWVFELANRTLHGTSVSRRWAWVGRDRLGSANRSWFQSVRSCGVS
jgi:hypothetical protein